MQQRKHRRCATRAQDGPLVLAVGVDAVPPAAQDRVSDTVDLDRLDVTEVADVYELTTPADMPFSFDLLTRAQRNAGWVQLSVAHVLDGQLVPIGGSETMAAAGLVIGGSGVTGRPPWLSTSGDGFARLTVTGSIQQSQVLAVRTDAGALGVSMRLVRISIGAESVINLIEPSRGDHPDVTEEPTTLYSSDSWAFGVPTIAISGDRTSVVAYEGSQDSWSSQSRYEMRLQHDTATEEVTGGGSLDVTADSGNWRDHEVAALFNVLAVARSGGQAVELQLSFDRGATFAQTEQFPSGTQSTRLVQIGMAQDYTIALVYSRSNLSSPGPALMLIEGRPASYDTDGSPTSFEFDPPQVIYQSIVDATPLTMGVAWSDGGDLVIGYGYTSFDTIPGGRWINTTEFRCAVRLWNGSFVDQLIDRDEVVGRDPSVAVLGQGNDMRIFYAYEGPQGVRLRSSDDAGATWSPEEVVGTSSAHTPMVFAREIGGQTRVDLLFMSNGAFGNELHASRWVDHGVTEREDYRLTRSLLVPTLDATGELTSFVGPPPFGQRLTQVGWFGYDAALDGEDIVVVLDEERFDGYGICAGAPLEFDPNVAIATGGVAAPGFFPAEPPPLAPGMTLAIDAPDPRHRHQLKLLRIH